MNKQVRFGILIAAILGTLTWLAVGGVQDTSTYYKTVAELKKMEDAHSKRLRVAGDVKAGSIQRQGREVRFTLKQDAEVLKVVYNGIDPLPDTFRDGAQAVAEGKLQADGVFHASKIQAKCASKYEAKPGDYQKLKKQPGAPDTTTTLPVEAPRAAL
ncbi:MAG: cytochrome c maturation protein CcmE [Acidobacteria bacterium]|nr:cytochrome c maturation protein CcmE [Acidobacteriota bacterium]